MTTLREALRTSPCPSPFGDDDGTVGHCVDAGHCGCDNSEALATTKPPENFDALAAALNNPPPPNDALKRLMTTTPKPEVELAKRLRDATVYPSTEIRRESANHIEADAATIASLSAERDEYRLQVLNYKLDGRYPDLLAKLSAAEAEVVTLRTEWDALVEILMVDDDETLVEVAKEVMARRDQYASDNADLRARVGELEAENKRNAAEFEYHGGRAEKERARAEAAESSLATARQLIQTLLDNDPNDMAADGVTVFDVWRMEALIALSPGGDNET